MIIIKSDADIAAMREACRITAGALKAAKRMVRPGMTTKDVDKAVCDYITARGAAPSFLGYGGFPGSACVSVNDVVIHGIPSEQVIREGDIVSVDVGAKFKGFHGDCANTFFAGAVSKDALALVEITRKSFYEGIRFAYPGNRVGDIGHAIQQFCEARGYSVVREYTGHGIGRDLHEDPSVPNYGRPGWGVRLLKGMTIAIEPMVNRGLPDIYVMPDHWTVRTKDGSLSAHYENTILITDDGPEILTVT